MCAEEFTSPAEVRVAFYRRADRKDNVDEFTLLPSSFNSGHLGTVMFANISHIRAMSCVPSFRFFFSANSELSYGKRESEIKILLDVLATYALAKYLLVFISSVN